LQAIDSTATKLGVQQQLAPVRTVEEFERIFATMAEERVDAVYVVPSSLTLRGRDAPRLLGELALKHRLPSMFGSRLSVVAGGLMSYSPDWIELTRQAAPYIDKILKGAKPADLAVAQSTKFELVINLKTAKAIGLTVPPSLLVQATEVIE
jgi:putative ABC transport system substrate-binding protein